jgi:hypothetical protein
MMVAAGDIEAAGRLVEEQDFGIADQRHAEHEPLTQALRQIAPLLVAPVGEAEQFDQFSAALGASATGDRMEFAHQHDVLPDAQIGVGAGFLGDDADVLAGGNRLGNDVAAADAGGAAGRRDVAGQHPNGRALAGTVRAEKPEDLATADGETDVIDGDALAVVAGQAIGLMMGSAGIAESLSYPCRTPA